MSLWDGIKKQFIEVLAWTEPSDAVLAYRFPVANHEIKDGAQLTVRESQAALFVDQGQAADVFEAGQHSLSTDNLPLLTKLESWRYGFNSPFKAEVYFFSLRQKLGQKWGTRQPITCRDPEFGSVQLRMFGSHSYHIGDVRKFHREVSGTREQFTTEDLVDQLLPLIVSAVTAAFAHSKLPFLDMAANLAQLGTTLRAALVAPFAELGLVLDSFVVESVSLPPALEAALHARQSRSIVGDLQQYAQYQAASSIPDAARNPGGFAGVGVGIAAGAGLGRAVAQALAEPASTPPSAAVTPCAACSKTIEASSAFCRFCGAAQTHNCSACGAVLVPGSAFCSGCGRKVGV
jgi:membrane protease subunit (stomatin/prohibitin family)